MRSCIQLAQQGPAPFLRAGASTATAAWYLRTIVLLPAVWHTKQPPLPPGTYTAKSLHTSVSVLCSIYLRAPQVPFTLSCGTPGRLRWVTTNIARFDPSIDWPTDLDCKFEWNKGLKSYDGERAHTQRGVLLCSMHWQRRGRGDSSGTFAARRHSMVSQLARPTAAVGGVPCYSCALAHGWLTMHWRLAAVAEPVGTRCAVARRGMLPDRCARCTYSDLTTTPVRVCLFVGLRRCRPATG